MSSFQFKIPSLPDDVTIKTNNRGRDKSICQSWNMYKQGFDSRHHDSFFNNKSVLQSESFNGKNTSRFQQQLRTLEENQPSTSTFNYNLHGANDEQSSMKTTNLSFKIQNQSGFNNQFRNERTSAINISNNIFSTSLVPDCSVGRNESNNSSVSIIQDQRTQRKDPYNSNDNDIDQTIQNRNSRYIVSNENRFSSHVPRNSMFNVSLLPRWNESRVLSSAEFRNNIHSSAVTTVGNRILDQNSFSMNQSKLALSKLHSQFDNQSINSSIFSTSKISIKARFDNLLENLHHTLMKQIPSSIITSAVRKCKEDAANILEDEYSCMASVRDPAETASLPRTEISRTEADISRPTFSRVTTTRTVGGILNSNLIRTAQDNKPRLIASFEISKPKKSRLIKTGMDEREEDEDDNDDNDDNDDSFQFAKPRLLIKNNKKKRPSFKTNIAARGKRSKEPRVINLKNWCPVAVGADLVIRGVDEENMEMQTVALKKRVNNRKWELVNGYLCNLIGGPSNKIDSVLPKEVTAKLKNGLHHHWRILHKTIADCQKQLSRLSEIPEEKQSRQVEKSKKSKGKSPVESTPRTRRQILDISNQNSTLATKNPKENRRAVVVINRHTGVSPIKTKVSSDSGKASKQFKVPAKPKEKKEKDNVAQKEPGPSSKTRSGRTVKPPGDLWIGNSLFSKRGVKPKEDNSAVAAEKTVNEKDTAALKRQDKSKKRGTATKRIIKGKKSAKQHSTFKEKSLEETVVSDGEDKAKSASVSKRKRETSAVDLEASQTKKTRRGLDLIADSSQNVDSPRLRKRNTQKYSEKMSEKTCPKADVPVKQKKKTNKKQNASGNKSRDTSQHFDDFESGDFDCQLKNIYVPEMPSLTSGAHLSKSQLKITTMETPPLKFFSSNLRILNHVTPMQTPNWPISQRSESEVKEFQRRQTKQRKQKLVAANIIKSAKKTKKTPQRKDVKVVIDWITEKEVVSPKKCSKVLKYVIPSRRQEEEDGSEEDVDET